MSSEPAALFSAVDVPVPYPQLALETIAPEQARHLGFVPFPEHKAYFRLEAATQTLWYHPMTPHGDMSVVLSPEGDPYPVQARWGTDPKGQMAAILETLRRLSPES